MRRTVERPVRPRVSRPKSMLAWFRPIEPKTSLELKAAQSEQTLSRLQDSLYCIVLLFVFLSWDI